MQVTASAGHQREKNPRIAIGKLKKTPFPFVHNAAGFGVDGGGIKSVFPFGIALLSSLTSGLPRSIHCDLDGSVVGGHLGRICEHCDGQSEAFSCNRKTKRKCY